MGFSEELKELKRRTISLMVSGLSGSGTHKAERERFMSDVLNFIAKVELEEKKANTAERKSYLANLKIKASALYKKEKKYS